MISVLQNGNVGEYFQTPENKQTVAFGSPNLPPVNYVLENIRTYTESLADYKELDEFKELIRNAKRLVFLGTAFHPINMELLNCPAGDGVSVYATRRGISDEDATVVKKRIARYFHRPPMTFDMRYADTCSNIFNKYYHSLR